ncbi:MAG TPA: hypothetical protein PLQ19_02675 [Aeromicrobium sp.]|nr:hypothetical protein [Aeromicrobium sp.]
MSRFSRTRARRILSAELEAVRHQDADFDAGDVTAFTLPLLGRALLLAAAGVLPLIVVRVGDETEEVLLPLVASFALAAVCAAVVTWLVAIVFSALITMILYRKPPRSMSKLVVRTIDDSFERVENVTSNLMLLALIAGLLALAIGLPERSTSDLEHSVIEDLLASQVTVLLGVLAVAFLAEAARAAADIVDDQSPALAWFWALLITGGAWVVATIAGPLEFTTMVRRLLVEWLPATVNDMPRAEAINEVMPNGARWIATFGALPAIAVIWYYQARRNNGFDALSATPEPDA